MDKTLVDSVSGFNSYRMNAVNTPIEGLSLSKVDASYVFTPNLHRHLFFEVFVVLEGRGEHCVDFETVEIHPRTLHFIRPGQLHQIKMDEPIKGCFIMFESDFFARLIPRFNPHALSCFYEGKGSRSLNLDEVAGAEVLVEQLFQDAYGISNESELLCAALIMRLLIKSDEVFLRLNATQASLGCLTSDFLTHLTSTFPPEPSLSFYADKMHVNSNYLSNVVKEDTGKTAGEWIRETRVIEAKRLLKNSTQTMESIARYLNFTDAAYFCRFFKRMTGMTPKEWRQF